MKKLAAIVACLLVARVAAAQSYYVRSGATGAADGSNWTNAYPDLPATLQRGATYYLAAGSYAAHTFNDPESGTSIITVKKATAGDHGTAAGWNDSYASGQAVFTACLYFRTGYYTIDGTTGGGPGSWETGLGIKLYPPNGQFAIWALGPTQDMPPLPSHLTFRHLEWQGQGDILSTGWQNGMRFESEDATANSGPNDILFQYCYLHDIALGVMFFFTKHVNNFVVEYCEMARNYSNPTYHSEAAYMLDGNNYTFRYNRFVDIQGTAVISIMSYQTTTDYNNGINFYGNLVNCSASLSGTLGMGIVADVNQVPGATASNVKVYNNTVANCTINYTWGAELFFGSGNDVRNNLWVSSTSSIDLGNPATGTEDYNTLIDCTGNTTTFVGSHDASYASGDPFVNASAGDFRLSAPTDPGVALPAPYNVDMLGHRARADGSWDRGALQYTDGSTSTPGADGGKLPTRDAPVGCACSAGHPGGGGAALAMLVVFVGWCGSRRRRRGRR